ncbi:MAG: hypothetical protein P8Y69_17185 [Gammaproteobacteria bacterium]
MSNGIGTLNEGPLHQALKDLYLNAYLDGGGEEEVAVGGYVADVCADDRVIYEIQTGGFAPLKRKLPVLLETHSVVLVHPIAAVRKKGGLANVVEELVSIPGLLSHPNFQIEVVLIEEEEIRAHDPHRVRRRNGWRVVSRRLTRVIGRHRLRSAEDLFSLVEGPLPEQFTTRDLAEAMGQPRWLAQKLAYCLREAGVVKLAGKSGNALRYERTAG